MDRPEAFPRAAASYLKRHTPPGLARVRALSRPHTLGVPLAAPLCEDGRCPAQVARLLLSDDPKPGEVLFGWIGVLRGAPMMHAMKDGWQRGFLVNEQLEVTEIGPGEQVCAQGL